MRDIVRDAAIITVAKMAMTDAAYINVYTFLGTYADSNEEKQELRKTLEFFNMIVERELKCGYLGELRSNCLESHRALYWFTD